MPDLKQSLQGFDQGHIRIIAELWDIELQSADLKSNLEQLANQIANWQNLSRMIDELPKPARVAWDDLLTHKGRQAWAHFIRRHGGVREMGPAKRDRERPYLASNSAAEALWYRALIARSFLDAPDGPEEFAYIPDDLYKLAAPSVQEYRQRLGKPASAKEQSVKILANDYILDDACTTLASLRISSTDTETLGHLLRDYYQPDHLPSFLLSLLSVAGLLDQENLPVLESVRSFFESARPASLLMLMQSWLQSQVINELKYIPGITLEGEWHNDPCLARQRVLEFVLKTIESGQSDSQTEPAFISINSFIADIKESFPDFQRSGGDYDTWYIRDLHTGEYLRGFENWERVEGAYLRYMLVGPLHWLGIVDLAGRTGSTSLKQFSWEEQPASAFRLSRWGLDLIRNQSPSGFDDETATIIALADGRLHIPRLVPRSGRYQISRFTHWEGRERGYFCYRLSPATLDRAAAQGLKGSHLAALLRRYGESLPPSLISAINRWEEHGREAEIEPATILRLKNPELLPILRASRASRFLGEALSPGVILLRSGGEAVVLKVLLESGYFGDSKLDGG
jgi:hypothetical protein